MVESIIGYLVTFTIAIIVGGVLYFVRHDIREAKRKKEDAEHEQQLDDAVKKSHSVVAACNARRARSRLRE